jgi:NitT/TauT family transport system substrate-binding protein
MSMTQSRRSFMASATLGAAGLICGRPALAEEGPPEIASVRLVRDVTCGAPINLAEELVRAEGFSGITYVDLMPDRTDVQMLIARHMDIGVAFAADVVRELDLGTPITVLGGMHPGCLELFAHEPIGSIKDLKGRRVAVSEPSYAQRLTLSVMAAYVGLDPARDITWVTSSTPSARELYEAGNVDAYFTLPPEALDLRTRKIGRVLLRTAADRPWSQYFCCMIVTRADYARKYPAATKRLLRAILKATDFCATEPQLAAERLVGGTSGPDYAAALDLMSDLPYAMWREYDPEDTLRFFALRLHELGFIKSSPESLIAAGSDWRFLNEIKGELKV